jgi:phosphate transport system permease protein
MSSSVLLLVLAALCVFAFWLGRSRSRQVVGGIRRTRELHSLPGYYGYLTALWCGIPALLVMGLWLLVQDVVLVQLVQQQLPATLRDLPVQDLDLLLTEVRNLAEGSAAGPATDPALQVAADSFLRLRSASGLAMAGVVLAVALAGMTLVYRRIQPALRARNAVERIVEGLLLACSTLAVFITVGIILSVVYESLRFFGTVPVHEFLFGLEWSPQTAMRADQVGSSGSFGAVPLFLGTLMISGVAMAVAVPVGLFAAIYLAEYANRRLRTWVKPLLEILAGIPTVVYGFFAALTVGPLLRDVGASVGLEVASESALAAGLVMGIMIIPFISSLADDMITAVPQSLRDGAYALGATRSETIRQVVLRAALPGIVGGVLLAVSRAIGETMIVVMAAGLAANLTANPLEAVTTVTVQVVTLLTGDQEFDSPKTLAAFALGLVLFLVTLALNIIALKVVRKYREQYE